MTVLQTLALCVVTSCNLVGGWVLTFHRNLVPPSSGPNRMEQGCGLVIRIDSEACGQTEAVNGEQKM
jgi:hypothetical protein